jgi:hypothetical protein
MESIYYRLYRAPGHPCIDAYYVRYCCFQLND